MAITLNKPLSGDYVITQTYDEHVARAKSLGLCWKPGSGCRGYYYGGIDYGCPAGTPVLAAHDGVVETRMDQTGYGYHVRLTKDGVMTIYAHLRSFAVQSKQRVNAGDLIGYSGGVPGEPGNTTGPHLHFELRLYGLPTDPAMFIGPSINVDNIPALEYVRLKSGADYVNVRCGPGIEYQIVGRLLPEDDPKKVIGVDGEWVCLVKWCGVQLWVNAQYLERVDNAK